MTYDNFNQFCSEFPATTYVVQWGGSHVWKIGGKVFAIGGLGENNEPAFTFKVSESNFLFLSDPPGYRPAPYLASRGLKWIQCYIANAAKDDDLHYYLQASYRIVSSGLSKKKQKLLGIEPG